MSSQNIVNANQAVTPSSWSGVTTTGALGKIKKVAPVACYQVILTGSSGTITAIVAFEVSLDGTNWITPGLATVTVSGTAGSSLTDGFSTSSSWLYVRPNITTLTGTGATVTIIMGY